MSSGIDPKDRHPDQIDIRVVNDQNYRLISTDSLHGHDPAGKEKRASLEQLLTLPQSSGIGEKPSGARDSRRRSSHIHDLLVPEEESWDETQTLSVNHSTAPLTAKIVDIFEDCDSIMSEERNNLKPWDRFVIWISQRSLIVVAVVASFLTTIVLFVFENSKNLHSPTGNEPWVLSAIPGIISTAMLISYFVEIIFLRLAGMMITYPLWLFPLIKKSSSGYVRVILMAILVQNLILNWWLNTSSFKKSQVFFANAVLVATYAVGILFVVRNMFNQLFEMWATEKSFGKRVEAMAFLEDILLRLCCRTESDKAALAQILQQRSSRNYMMLYVESIRQNPMIFPINHENDQWIFSTDSSIEISSAKEMGLLADIIFKNIIDDSHRTATETIDLQTFVSYFDTPYFGVQSFRLMFSRQGNALQAKEVNREQFISAFQSIVNTRSVLANRLQSFANLSYLMGTFVSTLFWIVIMVIVCNIFGYELNQLVTAISALVLGVSFALSKTISRAVESIVFVFGTKPFQVNDAVSINGNWYQVYKIGLLETKFKDGVNKLVRYSNLVLADLPIVNLTNSFGCVTRIATQIRLDVSVEALNSLKASILKYTINNPTHWKPRVTVFLNDISLTSAVELEIRVDSVYSYVDGGSFRVADTDLKNHIRKKMLKLGIEYLQPTALVKVISGPDPGSSANMKSREVSGGTSLKKALGTGHHNNPIKQPV